MLPVIPYVVDQLPYPIPKLEKLRFRKIVKTPDPGGDQVLAMIRKPGEKVNTSHRGYGTNGCG